MTRYALFLTFVFGPVACATHSGPSSVATPAQAGAVATGLAAASEVTSDTQGDGTVASTLAVPSAASKAGPVGAMCGGIAGFGCAPGLYCDFPLAATCGAADQAGVCKAIPEMCSEQYEPVCGCNDKTYPNACFAAREGVSVGSRGECAPAAPAVLADGQLCGTRGVQGECAPNLYCKYHSACGATDSGGTCAPRPKNCTRIYLPVCGCDGKTYASDCVAASHGLAVQHPGACVE